MAGKINYFNDKNLIINPLISFFTSLIILINGLIFAKNIFTYYIFLAIIIYLIIIGYLKTILRLLPLIILTSFIFLGLTFLITYQNNYSNIDKALNELIPAGNRLLSLFLPIVINSKINASKMSKMLFKYHFNKKIILGFMIVYNFFPLLKEENKKVKLAMKTRNVSNIFNLKIFYRAYLIPLLTRLTTITDTLSISINTRRFSFKKKNRYIFNETKCNFNDFFFLYFISFSFLTFEVLKWII